MFGLSFGELAIIAILALLLLGPDKIPETARMLAKGLKDLRRATEDIKEQIGTELNVVEDVKRTVTGALAGALDAANASPTAPPATPLPPRSAPPAAAADNIPGLEAALVEPEAPAAPAPPPAPETDRR
jgi:sec-independent protein translocase protein TatB